MQSKVFSQSFKQWCKSKGSIKKRLIFKTFAVMGWGGLEKKIDPRKNPFVLYLKYTSSSFYPATKATVPAPVTEMWTTLFSSYYLQMLEHWNTVRLRKVRPGWKTLYFHEKLNSVCCNIGMIQRSKSLWRWNPIQGDVYLWSLIRGKPFSSKWTCGCDRASNW